MTQRILLAIGAVLVFGFVNWQIVLKERLRAGGQIVYLDLAPVDPRSLMQGDYMALNFGLARQIGGAINLDEQTRGTAVVSLDEHGVARFSRIDTGSPLGPREARLRFRVRNGAVWLGTNAFFFEEGSADRFAGARYAQFRVSDAGEALLVDLRDAQLGEMRGRR